MKNYNLDTIFGVEYNNYFFPYLSSILPIKNYFDGRGSLFFILSIFMDSLLSTVPLDKIVL